MVQITLSIARARKDDCRPSWHVADQIVVMVASGAVCDRAPFPDLVEQAEPPIGAERWSRNRDARDIEATRRLWDLSIQVTGGQSGPVR